MFRQNTGEQLGQPFLDSVRITIDESTDAQNGSVALANGFAVIGITSRGYVAILEQPYKAILGEG